MRLFKRRGRKVPPCLIHPWYLTDAYTTFDYYGDGTNMRTITCPVCGEKRNMTEYQYKRFKELFNVTEPLKDSDFNHLGGAI